VFSIFPGAEIDAVLGECQLVRSAMQAFGVGEQSV